MVRPRSNPGYFSTCSVDAKRDDPGLVRGHWCWHGEKTVELLQTSLTKCKNEQRNQLLDVDLEF